MKGVVAVAGREHQLMVQVLYYTILYYTVLYCTVLYYPVLIVQGVHDTYDTYQTKLWDPDTERKNTLGKYHHILTFGKLKML